MNDDLPTDRDGHTRSPVDLTLPVEQMPGWANPGYLLSIRSEDFAWPTYSRVFLCGKHDTRWRELEAGDECWLCVAERAEQTKGVQTRPLITTADGRLVQSYLSESDERVAAGDSR